MSLRSRHDHIKRIRQLEHIQTQRDALDSQERRLQAVPTQDADGPLTALIILACILILALGLIMGLQSRVAPTVSQEPQIERTQP